MLCLVVLFCWLCLDYAFRFEFVALWFGLCGIVCWMGVYFVLCFNLTCWYCDFVWWVEHAVVVFSVKC